MSNPHVGKVHFGVGKFFGMALAFVHQRIHDWPGFLASRGAGEGEMVVGPVPGGASFARIGRSDELPVVAYHHLGRYFYLRSVPPEVWEGTRRCLRMTVTYEETDVWAAPWARHLSCENGFSAEVHTTIHGISPLSLRSADPLLVLPPRGGMESRQDSPALPSRL